MKIALRYVAPAVLVAAAVFGASFTGSVDAAQKKTLATDAVKKLGSKTVGPVALTTSDCKLLLGGTVVQVFDGRCGASGAYCKSSQGSACISEK